MSERVTTGLDIGSAGVRAAELATRDGASCLMNFGQVGLPPGAVPAGILAEPAVVTLAIQRLWKERRFAERDVTLGLANAHVVVRAAELPWVDAADLQKSLPYLVGDLLPIPVEDAVLDFMPFAAPVKGEPMHGLLVASPREHVTAMVRCAERAGLRPVAVDLASFALLRSTAPMALLPPPRPAADARRLRPATAALVDIGASVTNIVLHQGGVPKVVRIVPRGGSDVTAMLADRLGMSVADAEALKLREGMGAPGSNVEMLVRLAVTPLLHQLRGSIEYFVASHAGARVDRILLCGGGAQLRGLPEAIAVDLNLAAELVDPMAGLPVHGKGLDDGDVQRFRPHSAVPIGLAMGAI